MYVFFFVTCTVEASSFYHLIFNALTLPNLIICSAVKMNFLLISLTILLIIFAGASPFLNFAEYKRKVSCLMNFHKNGIDKKQNNRIIQFVFFVLQLQLGGGANNNYFLYGFCCIFGMEWLEIFLLFWVFNIKQLPHSKNKSQTTCTTTTTMPVLAVKRKKPSSTIYGEQQQQQQLFGFSSLAFLCFCWLLSLFLLALMLPFHMKATELLLTWQMMLVGRLVR